MRTYPSFNTFDLKLEWNFCESVNNEYGISLWWIEHTKKEEIDQRDRFLRFGISRKTVLGRYLRRSISSRSGLRLPPSKCQVEEEVAHYSLEVIASPETSRRRRNFARKVAAENCFRKNQKCEFDFRNWFERKYGLE